MRPPADDDDDASSDSIGDRADTEETGDGDSVGGGSGQVTVGTGRATAAPTSPSGGTAERGAEAADAASQVKDGLEESAGAEQGVEDAVATETESGSEAGTEAGERRAQASAAPEDPSALPSSTAPTALDRVLRELGVFPLRRQSREAAAAAELESKHRAVALAARADAQSLPIRLERAARMREHANRNVNAEADELAKALHRLNYLCKESESIELLGAARQRISFLLRAVQRASTTAETMGALRLEERLSGWMESALNYEDHLRQQLETLRAEQEETRRMLSETGALKDSNLSTPENLRLIRARSPASKLELVLRSTSSSARIPSTFRRPLSSASSDSPGGGNYAESVSSPPLQTPEEHSSSTNETNEPVEEDPGPGSSEESSPRPSSTELPICELVANLGPHLRIVPRENTDGPLLAVSAPPLHDHPFNGARKSIDHLLEKVWPIDVLSTVEVCRWVVARLLLLAAVWFMVSAFMTPAEAESSVSQTERTLHLLQKSEKDSVNPYNHPPS